MHQCLDEEGGGGVGNLVQQLNFLGFFSIFVFSFFFFFFFSQIAALGTRKLFKSDKNPPLCSTKTAV